MKYEKPYMDINLLDLDDVIVTSGGKVTVDSEGDAFGDGITIPGL